jgi:hypothetical protein
MELVPIKIVNGEEKAWGLVCGLPRAEVCRATGATFDERAGAYRLHCYGRDFHVNPCDMLIASADGRGDLFLGKLKDFFRLAVLWYMTNAKEIPPTGRLLKPTDVKGGHRFTVGTHVLPLEAIAQRFRRDREGFLRLGRAFGAEELPQMADAALRFFPLPRVPVTVLLWLEDEEFPPRVDLFFDSTCEFQLALSDVIWAVAMMTCVILADAGG